MLQIGLSKFKSDMATSIGDIKDSIQKESSKYKLKALEDRVMFRQDDIIKALTKKSADRDDTLKKFRIANFHIRNIFNILNEHI